MTPTEQAAAAVQANAIALADRYDDMMARAWAAESKVAFLKKAADNSESLCNEKQAPYLRMAIRDAEIIPHSMPGDLRVEMEAMLLAMDSGLPMPVDLVDPDLMRIAMYMRALQTKAAGVPAVRLVASEGVVNV